MCAWQIMQEWDGQAGVWDMLIYCITVLFTDISDSKMLKRNRQRVCLSLQEVHFLFEQEINPKVKWSNIREK